MIRLQKFAIESTMARYIPSKCIKKNISSDTSGDSDDSMECGDKYVPTYITCTPPLSPLPPPLSPLPPLSLSPPLPIDIDWSSSHQPFYMWSDEASSSPTSQKKIENFIRAFGKKYRVYKEINARYIALFTIGFQPGQKNVVRNFSMFIFQQISNSYRFELVDIFYSIFSTTGDKSINKFEELIEKYQIRYFLYNSHYDIVTDFIYEIPYLNYIKQNIYQNIRCHVKPSVIFNNDCIIKHRCDGCSFCCCIALTEALHQMRNRVKQGWRKQMQDRVKQRRRKQRQYYYTRTR